MIDNDINKCLVFVFYTASTCDDGWSNYLDSCYWPSNVTDTHASSALFCSSKGGLLVSIKDNAEYTFVKSIR